MVKYVNEEGMFLFLLLLYENKIVNTNQLSAGLKRSQ